MNGWMLKKVRDELGGLIANGGGGGGKEGTNKGDVYYIGNVVGFKSVLVETAGKIFLWIGGGKGMRAIKMKKNGRKRWKKVNK
ncbi:unnamed protein product [Meloidogyne enterolobii]|uniref:Uncharacterized protein n=1 Tax=Meloidogyne enterolobii TaxID=390850 RepID=A0ACB0Z9M3_MELEN